MNITKELYSHLLSKHKSQNPFLCSLEDQHFEIDEPQKIQWHKTLKLKQLKISFYYKLKLQIYTNVGNKLTNNRNVYAKPYLYEISCTMI